MAYGYNSSGSSCTAPRTMTAAQTCHMQERLLRVAPEAGAGLSSMRQTGPGAHHQGGMQGCNHPILASQATFRMLAAGACLLCSTPTLHAAA